LTLLFDHLDAPLAAPMSATDLYLVVLLVGVIGTAVIEVARRVDL
jgi:hypothetical protein